MNGKYLVFQQGSLSVFGMALCERFQNQKSCNAIFYQSAHQDNVSCNKSHSYALGFTENGGEKNGFPKKPNDRKIHGGFPLRNQADEVYHDDIVGVVLSSNQNKYRLPHIVR